MSARTDVFAIAVAIFLVTLVVIASYYYVNARKSSKETFESLLGRLIWVDRNRVALIALDLLNDAGDPKRQEEDSDLDPAQIWTLIGGLEGLEALETNCDVLIDLAHHVQHWYPEALVVAEQLRLNAREIKWHLGRLKSAAQTGNLDTSFPDYAQRAIATYYLMTKALLALYEKGNLPGFAELLETL